MEQSNNDKMLIHMRNLTDCIAAMLHSMANIQTTLYSGNYQVSDFDVRGVGELLRSMNLNKADLMDWEETIRQWSRISKLNKLNENKD